MNDDWPDREAVKYASPAPLVYTRRNEASFAEDHRPA